jgi:ribosome recycling factor
LKVAGGYAENARIAVRNVRRDGMDQVKKSDDLSEDDQKIWSDEIQELTNKSIKKIDKVMEQKQAEIMQV